MKNIYFAVTVKEDEKYYSYMVKSTDNTNVLSTLNIKNIVHANVYPKKQAEETVRHWNECYKKNGTYMFAEPSF